MEFGVFDHLDRGNLPLRDFYESRLALIAQYDRAGFHAYHVAEHHATPLGMAPSPSVFLAAAAQRTRRLRLGTLVYALPLHHPLRMIEEICMLDHLSGGRIDLGFGRGSSPIEIEYYGRDPATAQQVYEEALDIVLRGLGAPTLDAAGAHFRLHDVPMVMAPLQRPHPPIWYPSSSAASAAFIGAGGYNFSTLGSVAEARKCVDAYKADYAKRSGPSGPPTPFAGGTAIAVNRHVVVAATDEEAKRIAAPAYDRWYASLMKLWRENKVPGPGIARDTLPDVGEAMAAGSFIVGSPATVRAEIERQIAAIGVNYFICGMYFGNMTHAQAMRSLDLFAADVMPHFAAASAPEAVRT